MNLDLGIEYEVHLGRYDDTSRLQRPTEYEIPDYKITYESIDDSNNYGYELKTMKTRSLYKYTNEIKRLTPFFRRNKHISGPMNGGGIHVNISPINAVFHKRCLNFLMGCNEDFLLNLSGRSYDSFVKFSRIDHQTSLYYHILSTRKQYAYEFRMFAANSYLVKPAIQMAHAMFSLAEVSDGDYTFDTFMTYINDTRIYRQLANRCNFILKGISQ